MRHSVEELGLRRGREGGGREEGREGRMEGGRKEGEKDDSLNQNQIQNLKDVILGPDACGQTCVAKESEHLRALLMMHNITPHSPFCLHPNPPLTYTPPLIVTPLSLSFPLPPLTPEPFPLGCQGFYRPFQSYR